MLPSCCRLAAAKHAAFGAYENAASGSRVDGNRQNVSGRRIGVSKPGIHRGPTDAAVGAAGYAAIA